MLFKKRLSAKNNTTPPKETWRMLTISQFTHHLRAEDLDLICSDKSVDYYISNGVFVHKTRSKINTAILFFYILFDIWFSFFVIQSTLGFVFFSFLIFAFSFLCFWLANDGKTKRKIDASITSKKIVSHACYSLDNGNAFVIFMHIICLSSFIALIKTFFFVESSEFRWDILSFNVASWFWFLCWIFSSIFIYYMFIIRYSFFFAANIKRIRT